MLLKNQTQRNLKDFKFEFIYKLNKEFYILF